MNDRTKRLVEFNRKMKAEAMEKVNRYFTENPFSNARKCSEALGMNYQTVLRHVKELKAGNNG